MNLISEFMTAPGRPHDFAAIATKASTPWRLMKDESKVYSSHGKDFAGHGGVNHSAEDCVSGIGADPLFWPSSRLGFLSAWYGHVPFAHWLVAAVKPRRLVELGTHNGVSYAAFCESVLRCGLACQCHAVDTWEGDTHAGVYEEQVFDDLKRFNDARYGAFSTLIRGSFAEACINFPVGSIDLLHIDGLHTYEAVRADYEAWLPKMSSVGIVLFHDTEVREGTYGVWRLWSELQDCYPSFNFLHGYGLGVLAVGPDVPDAVRPLFGLVSDAEIARVRSRFEYLGDPPALRSLIALHADHFVKREPLVAPSEPPETSTVPQPLAAAEPRRLQLRSRLFRDAMLAPRLGIGVVTYNRCASLKCTIECIRAFTSVPYELLVSDDGSTDGTAEMLESMDGSDLWRMRCHNKGVNWNKNRLLYYLSSVRQCDVILLIEDDSLPVRPCWEQTWIAATRKWGHINNAGEWFAELIVDGAGTADQPFRSKHVSAQCAGFSREALEYVGFFDPALEDFGGGHAEHSYRMTRAGYGGEFRVENGLGSPYYYLISGGIAVTQQDSGYERPDSEAVKRYMACREGPIYRAPWRDDAEQMALWDDLSLITHRP